MDTYAKIAASESALEVIGLIAFEDRDGISIADISAYPDSVLVTLPPSCLDNLVLVAGVLQRGRQIGRQEGKAEVRKALGL